jgi:DNA-binding response OmpR family regulator
MDTCHPAWYRHIQSIVITKHLRDDTLRHQGDIMGNRLLIIEDEDTFSASMQRVLTREGYQVDVAGSSETAIQLLGDGTYDLIISDIVLPGLSGIDLLKRFRQSRPEQKVIIMTAHVAREVQIEAADAGACDFLLKPLRHDELKEAVRSALTRGTC